MFGGTQREADLRVIEKYDSVLDIWTSLTYKAHLSLVTKANQILYL